MPTYIALTVDDLDAELKKENAALANFADYTTRRARCYDAVLAAYQETLAGNNDQFVIADVTDAPIAIGTAKITDTVDDWYEVTPPSDFRRVAGNTITVFKTATSTSVLVPRMTPDSIVLSGGSQTPNAFYEKHGKIIIYCKDADAFDNTASCDFQYYRALDATQTTGTALDIKQEDFLSIVNSTLQLITQ